MTIDAIKQDGLGPYFVRDPRSSLPVSVDWTAWLTREGTTIATSAWTAETGLVLANESHTGQVASVTVSGGGAGLTYVLRNTVTCANGVIDSRSMRVVVKDR